MRFYRAFRWLIRAGLFRWLRLQATNGQVLNLPGPTIVAPVHRSHLDSVLLGGVSERRLRALGKESLFTKPGLSWACAALGAIPVRRGEADRDAMKAAKALLDAGETMIVFPEGTRQSGNDIGELFDGVAWLAAKTGARVIPVGISGTEQAFGGGAKKISRSHVQIVCGEPLAAPVGPDGKRVTRQQMQEFTASLATNLQQAQNRAVAGL